MSTNNKLTSEEIMLKDWEVTKDRIKFFDEMLIRLRERGFVISGTIQATGLLSMEITKNPISGMSCTFLRSSSTSGSSKSKAFNV